MDIGTLIVKSAVTDDRIDHGFGKCIPGAQILPFSVITENVDRGLCLNYGIVE